MLLILGKLLKGSSHPQRPTWAAWGQAAAHHEGMSHKKTLRQLWREEMAQGRVGVRSKGVLSE
jgi:hypothetical protein